MMVVTAHSAWCQKYERVVERTGIPASMTGSSLVQGTATMSATMTQISWSEDPFGDLEDSFATSKAGLSPFVSAAILSFPHFDSWFWFRCVRDIVLFAIFVGVVPLIAGKVVEERSPTARKDKPAEIVDTQAAPLNLQYPAVNFLGLMEAARSGDEARWRSALETIPNVSSARDRFGSTALHVAASASCAAMTATLLEMRGVDVDAKDVWEETPLHFAARAGSVEVCTLLMANGAKLNAVNDEGVTPLLAAATASQKSACQLLLDKGAACGGVADSDLPPMLAAIFVDRLAPPL